MAKRMLQSDNGLRDDGKKLLRFMTGVSRGFLAKVLSAKNQAILYTKSFPGIYSKAGAGNLI